MAVNQAAHYPALLHPGAGESETAPFAGAGRITNHVNCGMPPVFEAVELESLIKPNASVLCGKDAHLHLWLAVLLIAAMGLVLGLLGGGGSILTVPILVYVLGVEAHAAISLSLILVGSTALVGAFLHQEAARVAWKQGLLFFCFGIPLNLLGAGLSRHVSGTVLLLLFGVLMGISGTAMLYKRREPNATDKRSIWPVVIAGATVGFLAGFLGVGGGFMVVPSLVLFLHIPIKSATGTSLLVIAANSALALLGHRHSLHVDWSLMLQLMAPALLTTYLGVKLTEKLSARHLRWVFGVFVILLGVFMVASNTSLMFKH
jgi:uncharacterized membrane protein YfcA